MPEPIIEGWQDAAGEWHYQTLDPLAACPDCGFAQGAHTPDCPSEQTAAAWWGR